MKRFLGFVKKEFLHIFRDGKTLIILFGLPVVMIIVFGYVVTMEIHDVEVGIWDRSRDAETRRATQKIFSSGYFLPAGYLEREEQIGELFRSGKAKVVVVFEEDFEKRLQDRKAGSHPADHRCFGCQFCPAGPELPAGGANESFSIHECRKYSFHGR